MYLFYYIYSILLLFLHLQYISAANIHLEIQIPKTPSTQQLKDGVEQGFTAIMYDIHVHKVMRNHRMMKAFEWDMDRGREFAKHEWQRLWRSINSLPDKMEALWKQEEAGAQYEQEQAEAEMVPDAEMVAEEELLRKAEKAAAAYSELYEDSDEGKPVAESKLKWNAEGNSQRKPVSR